MHQVLAAQVLSQHLQEELGLDSAVTTVARRIWFAKLAQSGVLEAGFRFSRCRTDRPLHHSPVLPATRRNHSCDEHTEQACSFCTSLALPHLKTERSSCLQST